MEKNQPEKKFSTGAIVATVWQNQGKDIRTGAPTEYRTVSFQRRYKDQQGNWQSTSSLRLNDLPRANVVLQKAYEYLILRENHQSTDNALETQIEEVI